MSTTPLSMDALCARYGRLLHTLDADLAGAALYGADLAFRGQWGEPAPDLAGALKATGWLAKPPARDAQTTGTTPVAGLLLLPLVADSARLAGVLALRYPVTTADPARRIVERLAPALDCLRQELSASDAASRVMELSLLRTASQLDAEKDTSLTLEQLLETSLRRSGSEHVMFVVPGRGLVLQRSAASQPSASVGAELAGLPARLAALVGQLRRPLIINGPTERADRSAACRLLVVPLRCCNGRIEAAMAYLNPLEAAPYAAFQTLVAQAASSTLTHRLETELDRHTGFYNRLGLEAALARIRTGCGSLILADIDRLHVVNEMHGFASGDHLIQQVAGLLVAPLLPAGALAARLYGGCFAIVLPGKLAGEATEVATHMQTAMESLQVDNAPAQTRITLSCGVAEIASLAVPLAKALVASEIVMRLAKERGRSRVEVHVSENSSIMRRHDEVYAAADLREAMRTRQIVLFAQKIVSLRDSGAPPGFELLMRMRDGDGNFKSPQEFIAAAQRYQLLPALDRYVVDLAFELLAPHRGVLGRLRASVSINISGQSVGDPAFAEYFLKRLRESKLPPGIITVEITEQAAVTNLARAGDMMRRLHEAGCGIALDDFGTGANSLAYLRSMPITRIKIDGSFVRDMLTNSRSEAAVRSIAQLAQGFKLDSVAEFVESAQIADKLRQLGIERGQGHYFGKPEPLEQALVALNAQESGELRALLQM